MASAAMGTGKKLGGKGRSSSLQTTPVLLHSSKNGITKKPTAITILLVACAFRLWSFRPSSYGWSATHTASIDQEQIDLLTSQVAALQAKLISTEETLKAKIDDLEKEKVSNQKVRIAHTQTVATSSTKTNATGMNATAALADATTSSTISNRTAAIQEAAPAVTTTTRTSSNQTTSKGEAKIMKPTIPPSQNKVEYNEKENNITSTIQIPESAADAANYRCSDAFLFNNSNNVSNVFLHIGPLKTGTTSVQNHFACHQTDFLQEHNTYFLGKVNPKDIKDCNGIPKDFVRNMVQYKSAKDVNKLRREIESHVALGQHVVLSDEMFFDIPDLVGALFGGMEDKALEYNIIIVAGYRDYHDWFKSWYYYRNAYPVWWEGWWEEWDVGGINATTFREFWKQYRDEYGDAHPTIQNVEDLRKAIIHGGASSGNHSVLPPPCTRILDLRNGANTVEEFARLIVGGKPKAASAAAEKTKDNINKGKPFAADSEILALKLKSEGLIDERLSRRRVVDMLQKKMDYIYNGGDGTPPIRCLDQNEEKDFWNITLTSEWALSSAGLLLGEQEEVQQQELRRRYRKLIDNKLHCNILLDEMLQEEAWRAVLPCLLKNETAANNCWFRGQ